MTVCLSNVMDCLDDIRPDFIEIQEPTGHDHLSDSSSIFLDSSHFDVLI